MTSLMARDREEAKKKGMFALGAAGGAGLLLTLGFPILGHGRCSRRGVSGVQVVHVPRQARHAVLGGSRARERPGYSRVASPRAPRITGSRTPARGAAGSAGGGGAAGILRTEALGWTAGSEPARPGPRRSVAAGLHDPPHAGLGGRHPRPTPSGCSALAGPGSASNDSATLTEPSRLLEAGGEGGHGPVEDLLQVLALEPVGVAVERLDRGRGGVGRPRAAGADLVRGERARARPRTVGRGAPS